MLRRTAISVAARTAASPDGVWPLLAPPARRDEWAPHVRGAWAWASPTGGSAMVVELRGPGLLEPVLRPTCGAWLG